MGNVKEINIKNRTIKNTSDYENIDNVNPLYLITGEADENIEESNGNKYLGFASTDKKKYWQSTQNFGMKLNI